jgi:hypothetical protein
MYWFSPRLRRHWLMGYGSPRSLINDDAWQAGNRFAGLLLALFALLAMSFQVTLWPVIAEDDKLQAMTVAMILALPFAVMYLTEKYLARLFKN